MQAKLFSDIFGDSFLFVNIRFPLYWDFSHEATTDPSSFRETIRLAPMPESYDLDRGLLLAVQAIQVRSRSLKFLLNFMSWRLQFNWKFIFMFDWILFAYYLCSRLCWRTKVSRSLLGSVIWTFPDTSSSFLCFSNLPMQMCFLHISSIHCHMELCIRGCMYIRRQI